MNDPGRALIVRRILLDWAQRYAGLILVILVLIALVIVAPTTAR